MVLRMMFLVVGMVLGMALGWEASDGQTVILLIGAGIGAGVGTVILAAEQRLKAAPLPVVLCGGGGLVAGLLVASLIALVTGLVARSPHSFLTIPASLMTFWECPIGD